jgi:exopolyphosphatase/guanosine-5'-triphosphate,3'-diphosphate pyrophosphatase
MRGTGKSNDGASPTPAWRKAQAAAVGRWVRLRLGTTAHEMRVADIAGALFDLTAHLHRLDRRRDRPLLRLASMLHDVGRSVDNAEHPAEGAGMILADTRLPLSPGERRAVAYLTLYHRDDVPAAGDDDVLHAEDDHLALRRLLALLRCADALDSRSLESPRLVFALSGRDRAPDLHVACYVESDSRKVRRAYARRRNFRLLEEVLSCRVRVEVSTADALRMVA